jgi:hypothetical protein
MTTPPKSLSITQLQDGGYVVSVRPNDSLICTQFHAGYEVFASTSIEEALKYIKREMEPRDPK